MIFFSNIVKNLKIPEHVYPLSKNIGNFVLKVIVKYKQHLSIPAIKQKRSLSRFRFSFVKKKNATNKKIDFFQFFRYKTAEFTDIPTMILKVNVDLTSDFIFSYFNDYIAQFLFPTALIWMMLDQFVKSTPRTQKKI